MSLRRLHDSLVPSQQIGVIRQGIVRQPVIWIEFGPELVCFRSLFRFSRNNIEIASRDIKSLRFGCAPAKFECFPEVLLALLRFSLVRIGRAKLSVSNGEIWIERNGSFEGWSRLEIPGVSAELQTELVRLQRLQGTGGRLFNRDTELLQRRA